MGGAFWGLYEVDMWKRNDTNHTDIKNFIDTHDMNEFENKLEDVSLLYYTIYQLRFKENNTFSKISQKLNISTARISESLESISLAIRIFYTVD